MNTDLNFHSRHSERSEESKGTCSDSQPEGTFSRVCGIWMTVGRVLSVSLRVFRGEYADRSCSIPIIPHAKGATDAKEDIIFHRGDLCGRGVRQIWSERRLLCPTPERVAHSWETTVRLWWRRDFSTGPSRFGSWPGRRSARPWACRPSPSRCGKGWC